LVLPAWLLNATQGLITSISAAPRVRERALDQRHQLLLVAENLRVLT